MLLGDRLHARPLRIVIRHLHLLHRRQIHHAKLEVFRSRRARLHVVLHVLRQTRKQELESRPIHLRLHRHRLPLRRARILREQADLVRRQPDHLRRHHLVAVPPYRRIARRHHESRYSGGTSFFGPVHSSEAPYPRTPAAPQSSTPARPRKPPLHPAMPAACCATPASPAAHSSATVSVSAASSSRKIPSPGNRILCVLFLRERNQPLLELRKCRLSRRTDRRPIQSQQRPRQPKHAARHQHANQHQPRRRQPIFRKRIRIQDQREHDRRSQRGSRHHRRPPQTRIQPQPLLHLLDVEVELAPLAHTSSRCVPR